MSDVLYPGRLRT